jgi:hypothetical protein
VGVEAVAGPPAPLASSTLKRWSISVMLTYKQTQLGTNGLIRDQRYRTDHYTEMLMPD